MFRKILIILFLFTIGVITISAQSENWEIELTDDSIKVYTQFPEIETEDGEETLFKWKAEKTIDGNIEDLINTINDYKKHYIIYECEKSEIVSSSDSSTVVYYYFDSPWPAPNMDLVRTIKSTYDSEKNVFESLHIATPEKYADQDVTRLNYSTIKFKFTSPGNSKTKIELSGEFIPKGAPVFLAKSWFPEGPADIITNLIKQATVKENK